VPPLLALAIEDPEFWWKDKMSRVENQNTIYALRIMAVFVNAAAQLIPLGLMFVTHRGWPIFILVGFFFGVVPLFDAVLGDRTPEISGMEGDRFFTALLYIQATVQFVAFVAVVALASSAGLPIWASIVSVMSVGILNGQCALIAHEFGHKTGRINRISSNVILAIVGMGHFMVQHVRGHHVQVATPEDVASAPIGQDAYSFVLKSFAGEVKGGLRLEAERLSKRGVPALSLENNVLQSYGLALVIAVLLCAIFGWKALPWIVLHHFGAWFTLMLTTYIEHYGLLRATLPNGRREPASAVHSWNTDTPLSNLLLFNVQRHSDHHARPMLPYQALRDIADSPRLPTGYFGMMIIALIPPLWFRVMDPRVLAAAQGVPGRVNVRHDRQSLGVLETTN
jgi:alkane 1-monooxygenase